MLYGKSSSEISLLCVVRRPREVGIRWDGYAFQIGFLFAAAGRRAKAPTRETAMPMMVVTMRPETVADRFRPKRTITHPRNAASTPATLITAGCPLSATAPSSGLILRK